jgi:predicted transcriptional regulator
MNKNQIKQMSNIRFYVVNGMPDAAARGLSAMIRAAMSNKSKAALMAAAVELNLTNHPEFIV